MRQTDGLREAITRLLGSAVHTLVGASGGDVNEAYRCRLDDGRVVFVKTHAKAPPGAFFREAEGLSWLAQGGARVAQVLGVGDADPPLLALSWIESGRPVKDFDRQLGEMLANMHQHSPERFGWARDNFIGTLPQPNPFCEDWVELYGQHRLLAQADLAGRRGTLTATQYELIERVVARLPELVGPAEPPARLHGDLWSGNVMTDSNGLPVLIDPACYGGHREVDLAMLALFGRVSRECLDAYDAVYPRAPGADERVALYQLYPLLVHTNLFGGGYGAQAAAAAQRYL